MTKRSRSDRLNGIASAMTMSSRMRRISTLTRSISKLDKLGEIKSIDKPAMNSQPEILQNYIRTGCLERSERTPWPIAGISVGFPTVLVCIKRWIFHCTSPLFS